MKKTFFLLCFVQVFLLNAQNIKLTSGTYISQEKERGIQLKINKDNTYEMIFLSGKLDYTKDSLSLTNKFYNGSNFSVNQLETNKNASKIIVKFNPENIGLYYNPIYLGVQKDEKSTVEYLRVKNNEYSEENEIILSVDRAKYIYLVEYLENKATVSKYEIKETVSNLEIRYNPYSIASYKLTGTVSDNNIITLTDGRSPIKFKLVEDNETNTSEVNPLSTSIDKTFIAPDKEEFEETNYNEEYAVGNFDFKLVIDSSLKDALKTLNKTPKKYLVVYYNSTDKNNKADFESFIKTYENNTKSYMYDAYNAELDLYNFYLATSKDKNLFNSKITGPQLIVLNTEEQKLYNTTGTLNDNMDMFTYYGQLYSKLVNADTYAKFDKTVSNKNISNIELKTIFKNSLKIETPYIEASFAVDSTSVETNEIQMDDYYEEVAVDSAAVEVDYDYGKIKDEQNLYQLKSTKQVIDLKWKQVLDSYTKQAIYDEDLVKIIKKEIANDGFTIKLFKERKKSLTDVDFEGIDYLLKHYNKIIEKEMEEVNDTVANDYSYEYNNYRNLDDVLTEVFNQNTSTYQEFSTEHINKTLAYFKKYVEISGNKQNVFSSYLYALSNNVEKLKNKNEYYNSYETYFNSIIHESKNIYESLDEIYSKNYYSSDNYSYRDWNSYKSSFSSLANTVAWSIVENEKDAELIRKAIKWSETSLKLDKNNGYYLDTLAQLYYKNGQKELAISTQKKALENMKGTEDSSTYQEMQDVLTKMQNGSY